MKARTKIMFATWALAAAWLGCNAILGNESAEFVPDAGPVATVTVTTPAPPPAPPPPPPPSDAGPCDGAVLASDPQNCGACGHDCLGGACVASVCQPVVLASDVEGPSAIAVDDTHVYWSNSKTGDVMRAPLAPDGGAAIRIYDGPTGVAPGSSLAVDATHVYFVNPDADGGVLRCPKTGCDVAGPELVIAHLDATQSVAILDGGTLLFVEASGGRIGRCTLPACAAVEVLATDTLPQFATIANGVTYWTTLTVGLRGSIGAGGAAVTMANKGYCSELAVVGDRVVVAFPGNAPFVVPLDGGTPRALYGGGVQGDHLAVDGTYAYSNTWTPDGRILRCPVNGGCEAGTPIATGQAHPAGVAVDGKSIVWANEGNSSPGTIMRLAK